MTEQLVVRVSTQRHIAGAVVGVLGVGVADGGLFARFGVSTPQGRVRETLRIGDALEVAGLGTVTLVDVTLGGAGGRGAAAFEVERRA